MSLEIPVEAEALLTSEPLMAHLATCHEQKPHVAPLWYLYRDESIEITTTGRKLTNIRQNPHVAVSVQKDIDGHPQWGIAIQGTARVIENADEQRAALRRINRKYGEEDDAWSENTPVSIDIGSLEYWIY